MKRESANEFSTNEKNEVIIMPIKKLPTRKNGSPMIVINDKRTTVAEITRSFCLDCYFMSRFNEAVKNRKLGLSIKYSQRRYIAPQITNIESDNDYLITDKEIDKWSYDSPVFISAPTGAGKNTFIQDVLLPKAIAEYPNQNDLILILSNRIALTRQSKIQFAEKVLDYAGINKIDEMKNYRDEGIDNLFIDFDIVTVCSYHQCYERKLLNNRSFKFIVCDECHFFTSDALFNPKTNEMLKYIVIEGKKSIRVYMSATLAVVAQPIIESECFREKSVYLGESGCSIPIKYYYLARDYNYIRQIVAYQKLDELLECIKRTKSKWLIFVSSKKEGKTLRDRLKEIKIEDVVCLSRENCREEEEYKYIIENETTNHRIVITTSLLDNGVNIKNDLTADSSQKVLNVAIDSFDKTQFIQMLGRVRYNGKDKINLFIKTYSLGDLEAQLQKYAESLVIRLYNDMLSPEEKTKFILDYPNYFFHTLNEVFSYYNPCAIYQLKDQMKLLISIIRKDDPNFCIELSPKDRNSSHKLYEYQIKCLDNLKKTMDNNDYKPWYTSEVIELLETVKHRCLRLKRMIRLTQEFKGYEDLFNPRPTILDESFEKYILSDVIPTYAYQIIKDRYEYRLALLTDDVKKSFERFIEINYPTNIKEDANSYCYDTSNLINFDTPFEKALYYRLLLQLLKEKFPQEMYDINLNLAQEFANIAERYSKLFDENRYNYPLDEQLRWINKTRRDCTFFKDIQYDDTPTETQTAITPVKKSEVDIAPYITSEEELLKYVHNKKDGSKSQYLDDEFLSKHGIGKDSQLDKEIAKIFNTQSLSNLVKQEVSYKENKYKVVSRNSNKAGHPTYYFLIPCES